MSCRILLSRRISHLQLTTAVVSTNLLGMYNILQREVFRYWILIVIFLFLLFLSLTYIHVNINMIKRKLFICFCRCTFPHYCPPSSSTMLSCPDGWMPLNTSSLRKSQESSCVLCGAGTYRPSHSPHLQCLLCPPGHHCPPGQYWRAPIIQTIAALIDYV